MEQTDNKMMRKILVLLASLALHGTVFASQPVLISNAEHPVWRIVEGYDFLSERGGEIFAQPGEITICIERTDDCSMRFTVKIGQETNLTKAVAQLEGKSFDDQMLQLTEMARAVPKISVTNEAGRIILISQP